MVGNLRDLPLRHVGGHHGGRQVIDFEWARLQILASGTAEPEALSTPHMAFGYAEGECREEGPKDVQSPFKGVV
jgi:hypothetical protein